MASGTDIHLHDDSRPGPGRPRGFAIDTAVEAGVALFRCEGFEATSLDALTQAMGISRSSFYAAFGSKHGVLLKALDHYSDTRGAALDALAAGPGGLRSVLRAVAGLNDDGRGCLMVNCLTELCPRDDTVAEVAARHMRRVETVVRRCLDGGAPETAPALVAVALGASTLIKGGARPETVAALIDLAIARLTGG